MRPESSPIEVPSTICPKCSQTCRSEIDKRADGKYIRTVVICDACQWAWVPSIKYSYGEYLPQSEYEKYKLPEAKAAEEPAKVELQGKAKAPAPYEELVKA